MLNVYKASAGSGKTFRLTKDYIHLLFKSEKPNSHRNILAVTFTNKATEEMKSRIIHELFLLSTGAESPYRADLMKSESISAEAVNNKAKQIIIQILHDYSSFSINTIDSFFQRVIRSFARDIGINGGYNLELDIDTMLNQAVDNIYVDLSEDDNKQLLEWLTNFSEELIADGKNWNTRYNILELGYEIFKESFQHKATETNKKLHDREFLNKYKRDLYAISKDFINNAQKISEDAIAIIKSNGLEFEDFSGGSRSSIKQFVKALNEDFKITNTFRNMSDDVTKCYADKSNSQIKSAIINAYTNGLQSKMLELIEHIDSNIYKYNTAKIILRHFNTLGILSDLAMQIQKLTVGQNIMLISDSNLLLNKIIDGSDAPFIYEKTGLMIDHFMIDEFQDTSVLQWDNFLPLIKNSLSSGYNNLVVGDVKQSIYRWRNSDWKLLDNQIYNDIEKDYIREENLDTNWRSDKNIIDFNNNFFKTSSNKLQELLNQKIDEVVESMPQLTQLKEKITHAYKETEQKVSSKAKEGAVKFLFIDKDDSEDSWKEKSLEILPGILEDFQARGYKPCDIAILVNKNDEARQVVQKILQYKQSSDAKPEFSYELMGTEGLLVESALSVQFLLGILKLLIDPKDEIQRIIVNYEYAKNVQKLANNDALKVAVNCKYDDQVISALFSKETNELLLKYRQLSLFELIEKIIALFGLVEWNNESVYIQAFQDIVFKFVNSKTSDINSFLQWWSKNGTKATISTPENEKAFKIMTIHKSKGLEFKAVIIPFCDWELNKGRKIMWCETQEAPFNQMPLMPVQFTSILGESYFAEDYYNEMMHLYIDSLNLAYVAFTRPKSELIGISPLPKTSKKDGTITINDLSSLLYTCFNDSQENIFTDNFKSEENTFELGKLSVISQKKSTENQYTDNKNHYPICDFANRLKLKHKIGLFNRDEIDITETPLDYGNLMHEIFCRIQKPMDHQSIIPDFISEGRVTEEESFKISDDIDAFWKLPKVSEWFRDGVEVLNETTILTPEGHHYRPDRIILDGKEATVIDYKFGEQKLQSHNKQVRDYTLLLNSMGYDTKAYLCYVKLQEIIEVTT
ncbi:MAG: hypothetical protein BGO29_07910 [Bacteroidales bacterium 36-12]|nr:MAG: hypothetical protein BGO29_07910 [Bacteroidales bacterium 36-12]